RHNSAAASLWIGITQRLPLYGSAARSQHRIAFAFRYTELTLTLQRILEPSPAQQDWKNEITCGTPQYFRFINCLFIVTHLYIIERPNAGFMLKFIL
ncbi:hypothetical protein, partial [Leptospira weilii]